MKKVSKRLISLLLALVMCVSSFSGVFAKVVIEDYDSIELDLGFEIIDNIPKQATGQSLFNPTTLVTAPLKMLASRAFQELAAFSISNDVPGLSSFFKLLQTPAQRAAAAQRQMIQKVVTDIAEIKASVARIENQLKDVAENIDKYETASAFSIAANEFKSISSKYNAAWLAYESMYNATNALVEPQEMLESAKAQRETIIESKAVLEEDKAALEEALLTETDEAKKEELTQNLAKVDADIATAAANITKADETIASLQKNVDVINNQIDAAMLRFISVCNEGSGLTFAADLSAITQIIWNSENPTGSYLGAYEAFLRERYAFEHEIRDSIAAAYEMCVDTMMHMLTIYKEYYTYYNNIDPDNENYTPYTEAYFESAAAKITTNFDLIARSTRYDKLMITKDYTEKELAEFRENDPDFMPPENINQTITIGGKEYECYKVIDNKDKLHYIIPKENIPHRTLTERSQPEYASLSGMFVMDPELGYAVYRPTMMLDHRYTDDGRYIMVEANNLPESITDSSNVLTSLRSVSGLTDIPEKTKYIMLYHNECVNMENYTFYDDVYWNTKMLSTAGAGDAKQETVSSKSIYNDGKYSDTIVIYREVNTDALYRNEGVWKVIDKGEISNRTITVNDGQTLDLTGITVNPDNVNIHIIGGGKIISNPNITLTNSHIFISSDSEVYIENLNVKGRNYAKAVVEIVSKNNDYITFAGNCSFKAGSEKLTGLDVYEQHKEGMPLAASNGMYIAEGCDVTIYSNNAVFEGAAGGAGICTDALLTINGYGKESKITAKGSALTNIEGKLDNYYITRAVGAGIGVCFSGVEVMDEGIDFDYAHGYLGTKGTVRFMNVNVFADGCNTNSENTLYSDDIGGVHTDRKDFDITAGRFMSSNVATKYQRISPVMDIQANTNTFIPDVYTFEAFTKGSNGETTDGISVNVIGENLDVTTGKRVSAESGWMKLSDIGNDKGDSKQTVTGNSVGKITGIKVKTNSSNHWYPGKITVSSEYAGSSATVYGGRWIGNTEKTLSVDDNVYEVTIVTGSSTNSGTNANIFLFLQDDNGTVTDTIEISDIHQDANAFEKGTWDKFPIYAPKDFGECCHVFLKSDHSGVSPGWKVDKIEVKKLQGSSSDSGYTVNTGFWFEYENTVNFGKYSEKTGAYYLEVKTGGKSGAGTDSTIHLQLHGDKYSMETKSINMSDMAGDGNNFEKNDKDCFYIGYNVNGIGEIKSITISKNNKGAGADWYLESIKITEEVATGQTAKVYTFNIGKWIEESSYTFNADSPTTMVQNSSFDRDVLKGLKENEDGSYTLTVDRNVMLTEEVMATLQETGKVLEVIMTNEDKPIYSLTFDGSQITDYYSLSLDKGYSFADGNAMLDFISETKLPAGTKVRLYTENIGFIDADKLVVFQKGDDGKWAEHITAESSDGTVEFTLEEGRQLLINLFGTDLPTGDAEKDPHDNPPTGDSMGIYMITFMFMAAVMILYSKKKRISE